MTYRNLFSGRRSRKTRAIIQGRRRFLTLANSNLLEPRILLATTISQNMFTSGQDIVISDSQSITINAGVILNSSTTVGAAGKIKLDAPKIIIDQGVQLLANGPTPGRIEINANGTTSLTPLAIWNEISAVGTSATGLQNASISIGQSVTINGGAVSISSIAGDAPNILQQQASAPYYGLVFNQGYQYINQILGLPLSIVVKQPSSSISIGSNTSIVSSGDVRLSSTANAEAVGYAVYTGFLKSPGFSAAAGFSYSDASATTELQTGASIKAAGRVILSSSTTNTAEMNASVARNTGVQSTDPNNVSVAFAGTYLGTTSTTTVDQGATIEAGKTVAVWANAVDINMAEVSTSAYRDGKVGVAIGSATTSATVEAIVNGQILAGQVSVPSPLTFNPGLTVNFASNSLVFPTALVYETGDAVVYNRGTGGAIAGLVSGQTYYSITNPSNPNALQLANT